MFSRTSSGERRLMNDPASSFACCKTLGDKDLGLGVWEKKKLQPLENGEGERVAVREYTGVHWRCKPLKLHFSKIVKKLYVQNSSHANSIRDSFCAVM